VWTMAAPYGNTDYVDVARTRFLINRGVNGGLVAPNGNADPFNLNCYIPATGAPASAFNQHVDAARSAGAWQIMLVHGFTGGSDSAYQPVDLAEFLASVDYAIALGDVWISSVVEIGAYWRAQKLFSELSVASVDAGNSWSWTLPDHFPPGKYLRVTVDGGTLAQDGTPLTWDPHGYYEVALDVPSLVLSP